MIVWGTISFLKKHNKMKLVINQGNPIAERYQYIFYSSSSANEVSPVIGTDLYPLRCSPSEWRRQLEF